MKIIKSFLSLLLITVLFSSCGEKKEPTQEECINQNKILKSNKVLNFRTGKYEDRKECSDK